MSKKKGGKSTNWQAFADSINDNDSWAVTDDMPTGPAFHLPTAPGSMLTPGEHHHKPLPTQPPYTAHVSNLSFDLSQDALGQFFYENGNCQVTEPRLVFDHSMNRPKGYGYVTFADLESLKSALKLHGKLVIDRPIRVDVAEARQDDRRSRFNNNSNNSSFSSHDNRAGGASTWRNESGPGTRQFEPMHSNRAGGASTWRNESGPGTSQFEPMQNNRDNRAGSAPTWRNENGTKEFKPMNNQRDSRDNRDNRDNRDTRDNRAGGASTWRNENPTSSKPSTNSPVPGSRNSPFDSFDRSAPRREFVPLTQPQSATPQRKKLDLAPRRTATPDIATPPQPSSSSSPPLSASSTKSNTDSSKPKLNPFGAAKPVDTHAKLREVELKLQEKQQLEAVEQAEKNEPKEEGEAGKSGAKEDRDVPPGASSKQAPRRPSGTFTSGRTPTSPSDSSFSANKDPVRKTQYRWGPSAKSVMTRDTDSEAGEFKPVQRHNRRARSPHRHGGRSPNRRTRSPVANKGASNTTTVLPRPHNPPAKKSPPSKPLESESAI